MGGAMTDSQARDAVNGAALVVAGLYFYRRLTEPSLLGGKAKGSAQPKTLHGAAGQVVGLGPLPDVGRFIIGWGVVFIMLSLLEGFAPELAGTMALLVGLSALLVNGSQAAKDIGQQLKQRSEGKHGH